MDHVCSICLRPTSTICAQCLSGQTVEPCRVGGYSATARFHVHCYMRLRTLFEMGPAT